MKTFEILSLEIENIKTYKYEKISFSQGNNVFIGENGAGKSTILECIYLALFGETLPNRNLIDIIRFGEKQGKIIIKFQVDGNNYRIEDVIEKKDDTTPKQTQILINESTEETLAEGKNAVQTKIEEVLTLNASTFLNAVYASQGEIDKIITATKTERKKLFDRLFQIDTYEKAWNNLAKIEKMTKNEIENLENQIKILKDDLKQLPEKEKQVKEKNEYLKNLQLILSKEKKEFQEVNKAYTFLEKSENNYQKLLGEKDVIEREINELEKKINELFSLLKKKIPNITIDSSLSSIGKLKNELENKLLKMNGLLESLRKKENDIKINLEKISNLEKTLEIQIDNIKSNTEELDNNLKQWKTKIAALKNPPETWNEQIPIILKENESLLKNNLEKKEKIEKITTKISNLEVELSRLENEKNKYHTRIVKNRLNLAQEAGDNWKESIDEFSKINFEKEFKELAIVIEKQENNFLDLQKQKAIVDEELNKIVKDLEHLKNLSGKETCPTCKQKLSGKVLEEIYSSLNVSKNKFESDKKDLVKKLKEVNNSNEILKMKDRKLNDQNQLNDKIKPKYENLMELEKEYNSIENDCKRCNEELNNLRLEYSIKEKDNIDIMVKNSELLIYELSNLKSSLPKLLVNKEKNLKANGALKQSENELHQLKKVYNNDILQKLSSEYEKSSKEQLELIDLLDYIKALTTYKEKLSSLNSNLLLNQNTIKKFELIEGFKERESIKIKKDKLSAEISSNESLINSLKNDVLPALLEQQKILLNKEKDFKNKEEKLKQQNKSREITSILRGLMRELPNRLLPYFIDRINNTTSELLQSLLQGSDIQNVTLNDDYSININRLGNLENVSILSGGETIAVALALRLAFAKEFSTLDCLILDEPTIFLDEQRRQELVALLERNRLVRQMFVVTHDSDFERISDKTYFIRKLNNVSSIKPIESKEEINKEIIIESKFLQ